MPLALLLVVLALPACTSGGGCREAPSALLDEVMAHAYEDIRTGDFVLDRIVLVRSAVTDLPREVSGRDDARLLALTFVPQLKDPVAPGLGEVDLTGTLLIDADGEVVGPVDQVAALYFDYPEPREPGWGDRSRSIDTSDEALALNACVQR